MAFYHDGSCWHDTEKDEERRVALEEFLDETLTPFFCGQGLSRLKTLTWHDERSASVVTIVVRAGHGRIENSA